MPRPRRLRLAGLLVALAFAAGCADTKTSLERKGIEVKSGKLMKVYRF